MDRIIQTLLRLEKEKHNALIQSDAMAYENHVQAQLRLLDSGVNLAAAARESSESVVALSGLMRRNTALLLNLFSTSPLFAVTQTEYTSAGNRQARLMPRIEVEA